MEGKFEQLCEEVLRKLYEGKVKEGFPKVGDPAHVDGSKKHKDIAEDDDMDYDDDDDMNESDDVDGDEDDDMNESDDVDGDEDDDMNESDDEDDEDEEDMEEGFPNVGDPAHVDGTDKHKSNY
jgi:hypothetical protein